MKHLPSRQLILSLYAACICICICLQIGIPIAAGMLLPVTGTMLTPSIAGALMGLSSIGVMSNSLLLRLKFSSKQKQAYGAPTGTKILLGSDILMDQREKMNQSYSGTQWREAR